MSSRDEAISLGRVSGLYGVRGWIKVYSYTDPAAGILDYNPWVLEREGATVVCEVAEGRQQGKGLVARLAGVDDRDEAARWVGATITVERQSLPPTANDEYYWADLVGLEVLTLDGQQLGKVKRLLETGANDVLVVMGDRERLIPWIPQQVIAAVDLEAGQIRVDWDPEF